MSAGSSRTGEIERSVQEAMTRMTRLWESMNMVLTRDEDEGRMLQW